MPQTELQLPHKLTLIDRNALKISGVTGVVGFDEQTVLLHTTMGDLTVRGQELTLENLSIEGGEVMVKGTVHGLFYTQSTQKSGLWRRLMK